MRKNSSLLPFRENYVKGYYKNVDHLIFLSLFNILIITLALMPVIPGLTTTLQEEWGRPGLNQIINLCLWILALLAIRTICLATKKIIGAVFAHILMVGIIVLSIFFSYQVSKIDSLIEEHLYSDGLPYLYISIVYWSLWLHGGTDIALIGLRFLRPKKKNEVY